MSNASEAFAALERENAELRKQLAAPIPGGVTATWLETYSAEQVINETLCECGHSIGEHPRGSGHVGCSKCECALDYSMVMMREIHRLRCASPLSGVERTTGDDAETAIISLMEKGEMTPEFAAAFDMDAEMQERFMSKFRGTLTAMKGLDAALAATDPFRNSERPRSSLRPERVMPAEAALVDFLDDGTRRDIELRRVHTSERGERWTFRESDPATGAVIRQTEGSTLRSTLFNAQNIPGRKDAAREEGHR